VPPIWPAPRLAARARGVAEKIRTLREADACANEKGAVAALLRREAWSDAGAATTTIACGSTSTAQAQH
jgi:hypothetical protein